MSSNNGLTKCIIPSFRQRIYSIWFRHIRVYSQHIVSNAFPPIMETLLFLAAIGLGLSGVMKPVEGTPYLVYVATGIMAIPPMFTSAFECTISTFIRLEFDKVYDGMLSAPHRVSDLFIAEMLFSATKSAFYAALILLVLVLFGLIQSTMSLLVPIAGFLTGLLFAAISLLVTSFVKTINHFNFYFSGFISILFWFSETMFPASHLSPNLRWIVEALPLTHAVRLIRASCLNQFHSGHIIDLLYILGITLICGFFAIYRLKKRLIE